jgi:hypothetical protein
MAALALIAALSGVYMKHTRTHREPGKIEIIIPSEHSFHGSDAGLAPPGRLYKL